MPMKVEDKEEGEDDSEKKRCQIFELKTFGHKFIDYFCKHCCQCIAMYSLFITELKISVFLLLSEIKALPFLVLACFMMHFATATMQCSNRQLFKEGFIGTPRCVDKNLFAPQSVFCNRYNVLR